LVKTRSRAKPARTRIPEIEAGTMLRDIVFHMQATIRPTASTMARARNKY
jgi:hypothetical protein